MRQKQLDQPNRVTYECFITSGSLRMRTTSSASSSLNGRRSSLSVLATYFGSTITILDIYEAEMSEEVHLAVCRALSK